MSSINYSMKENSQQIDEGTANFGPDSSSHIRQYSEFNDSHELIGLDRNDLEKAAVLYEAVRAQRRKKDKKIDKKLADAFMKFLESKMQELSIIIMNPSIPKHIKSAHILNLRFEVFGLCFEKMNEQMLEEVPDTGKVYSIVFRNIQEIYDDAVALIEVLKSVTVERTLREHLQRKDEEIDKLVEELNQAHQRNEQLYSELIISKENSNKIDEENRTTSNEQIRQVIETAEKLEYENDDLRNQNTDLRAQNADLQNKVEQMQYQIGQMDQNIIQLNNEKQALNPTAFQNLDARVQELQSHNDELQTENEQMIQILIKRCK